MRRAVILVLDRAGPV
uniref:leu operon leader peptide n=1 Tax=Thermus thermophilus (strain ATCC 27634 / DSM 579 / HB8) TaxID=300852 RepID=LPL_THET8|nr:RecName: Full=leu operon leader peptide; AltName: Full=leu operon attenuator peptide [Thermus thermophilus HB8]pir/LFTWL/ leu leader peptide - Thermus aquaticus [Thermus aquaticus]CAA29823.1 unnamed protein product [Thermus thermophilus HB8]